MTTINPNSKRAQLTKLVTRKSGASIKAIQSKLNWQPHTIRAEISRLRKGGLVVTCTPSPMVTEAAMHLDLRTRRRETTTGKVSGGGSFGRGHVHHILTNPLYAGRIRHKKMIHEGQHPPLIDPDRWDRIQDKLQDGASRSRAKIAAGTKSLLCGKLFDETGDRLTPSHTKTRAGIRLRYYISHHLRLVPAPFPSVRLDRTAQDSRYSLIAPPQPRIAQTPGADFCRLAASFGAC